MTASVVSPFLSPMISAVVKGKPWIVGGAGMATTYAVQVVRFAHAWAIYFRTKVIFSIELSVLKFPCMCKSQLGGSMQKTGIRMISPGVEKVSLVIQLVTVLKQSHIQWWGFAIIWSSSAPTSGMRDFFSDGVSAFFGKQCDHHQFPFAISSFT